MRNIPTDESASRWLGSGGSLTTSGGFSSQKPDPELTHRELAPEIEAPANYYEDQPQCL